MAKQTTTYACNECGATSPKWLGRCPVCGKFGTLIEEIAVVPEKAESRTATFLSKPQLLSEIKEERITRIPSGIPEFDRALGGGIVPASLILIGGDPGIGKSTLLTQVSGNLAQNYKVLYASAEESLTQVKMRCGRLNTRGDFFIMNETHLENIEEHALGMDFLIIDSIQAVYLDALNSSAGSVGQVRECASRLMRFAKTNNVTVFIVGHVTKEGSIAGPKVLEHIMDTVLYFEGERESACKLLRCVKNRFGSTQEIGVFEMHEDGIVGVTDYSGLFLSENYRVGSIITPTVSGNRCMPVEVQSLLTKTPFGLPRRMASGIDYNKLVLLLAVLERRASVPFYNSDVYLNSMGGIKLQEPSIDLAIVLSLISSSRDEPIRKPVAAFGEIGLSGEIRGVNFAQLRVETCIKYGFSEVVIPKHNYPLVEKYKDKIKLLPLSYVREAMKIFSDN